MWRGKTLSHGVNLGLADKDGHGLRGWVRISVESAVPSGECPGKLRWGQRTLQPDPIREIRVLRG
jgi:hypothetical protein